MLEEIKNIYLPIIMAIFLGYIAYQQMRTNRDKLKLDLYNKRYEIYTDTLKLYHELNESEGSTTETLRKFIDSKEASKFLFSNDESIYNILNEIHKNSFKINAYKKHKNQHQANQALSDNMLEASNYINDIIPVLHKKLQNYLSF